MTNSILDFFKGQGSFFCFVFDVDEITRYLEKALGKSDWLLICTKGKLKWLEKLMPSLLFQVLFISALTCHRPEALVKWLIGRVIGLKSQQLLKFL